ncbi:unnamed protein product [Darwinula stevensoni]|uniref:Uncharacterized protein n=1 Tax=Darwinula stevensoni TaxID=69355 RepID=A0A7R8XBN9_9CRUS|nr:unnamed protein product [Darwinula stevensoni]CAG0886679.1 unnamed protein product [Darwinula stevensoni]
MSEQLKNWNKIRQNKCKLRDEYGVDGDELFESLSSKSVFTVIEEKTIRSKNAPNERFDEIFAILYRKDPLRTIPIFLEALEVKHKVAADYLKEGKETRKKPDYKSQLEAIFDILLEKNPGDMYEGVLEALQEMNRDDIIGEIQQV